MCNVFRTAEILSTRTASIIGLPIVWEFEIAISWPLVFRSFKDRNHSVQLWAMHTANKSRSSEYQTLDSTIIIIGTTIRTWLDYFPWVLPGVTSIPQCSVLINNRHRAPGVEWDRYLWHIFAPKIYQYPSYLAWIPTLVSECETSNCLVCCEQLISFQAENRGPPFHYSLRVYAVGGTSCETKWGKQNESPLGCDTSQPSNPIAALMEELPGRIFWPALASCWPDANNQRYERFAIYWNGRKPSGG